VNTYDPPEVRLDSLGAECVRYDLAHFSPKTQRTPQGFLKAPAFFTRAGVFEYRRSDGKVVRELRPDEEVFHADSLATLRSAPVIVDHPVEGLITPNNAKKYAVGWSGEAIERKDSMVSGEVTIMDAQAISDIMAGDLKEISMGYKMRLDRTAGKHPQYGEYDQVQRDIRYNHVALGKEDWGRAGSEVGIRLDADGAIQRTDSMSSLEHLVKQKAALLNMTIYDLAQDIGVSEWELSDNLAGWGDPKKEILEKIAKALGLEVEILIDLVPRSNRADTKVRKPMETMTITIGGVEFEVSKAAGQAFKGEQTRQDAKVQEITSEKEKLQGKFDAQSEELKTTKDKLEEASDPTRLDSKIEARVALVEKARKVLGEEAEIKGSDRSIQETVLRHDNKDLDLSSKSDDYVEARFDSFIEDFKPKGAQGNKDKVRHDALKASLQGGGGDKPNAEEARKRMQEDNAKAWQGDLAVTNK